MRTVSFTEARRDLSALLREVEGGGEVVITRRGKPVARLSAVVMAVTFDPARAQRAADGLRAASRGVTLGGLSIRDLVDEGRR